MTNSKTTDFIHPSIALNLHGLLLERVRRTPHAIAYRCYNEQTNNWEDFTWSQVSDEVSHWRAALNNENLQPGDRVAIMAHNRLEWVLFEQAALSLNLVIVPFYTNDRADSIGYIIQDAGIKLILIEEESHWNCLCEIYNQLNEVQRIVSLSPIPSAHDDRLRSLEYWLPENFQSLEAADIAGENLATIVYTSGTTGNPKGVMLSHANILWNADSSQRCDTFYTDDVFLSFLPLSHMFERTVGYYMAMMVGSTVAFARSIDKLAEDMLVVRPTILVTVPRIFERVYNKIQLQLTEKPAFAKKLFNLTVAVGWHRFLHQQGKAPRRMGLLFWPLLDLLVAKKIRTKLGGRLRIAISGGAPLSNDIARAFIGLGVTISQGYGMTELSPVVSTNRLDDNDPFSVGQALPEVEVKLGEQSELLVRSPGIMLGYYNNKKATAEIIDEEGWLHTGDVADIKDEHIYITGRLKDIIVLANGEKVPPADMELVISTDPLIEQAMILGEGRPFLCAIVTLDINRWRQFAAERSLDPDAVESLRNESLTDELLQRIAQRLHGFPGYAKVYKVHATLEQWTVENGLMTPTLKLKRKQILDKYNEIIAGFYEGH